MKIKVKVLILSALMLIFHQFDRSYASDLTTIKKNGVLRHLGIPYANFVTGSGDGMSVEIVKLFAQKLNVKYEYVEVDWDNAIPSLIGKKIKVNDKEITYQESTPIRGDLIASGITVIPWRQQVINFSGAEFPTQVWLVASAESKINPIKPSDDMDRDIAQTKSLLTSMGKLKTCLGPSLYSLDKIQGLKLILFPGPLNDIAPALLQKHAEVAILDVPDLLVAMEKWPGKIKVIGPISKQQEMAIGFEKNSVELKTEFDKFLEEIKKDGRYCAIVKKYYSSAFSFFPEFFKNCINK
ncbi:MAG: transporter substrate-binding domain-containing protein [Oligoflexia bacterium]|nr:transporter substrate-binding domain-containing protein [Oligoflexia bacterium]